MWYISSASLPPCQPRSGTHRALRGQSPAATHQALQQPSWSFIGPGVSATPTAQNALLVNSHPTLTAATWQQAMTTPPPNHNNAAAAAAATANLVWRPPSHLDLPPAPAVSVHCCYHCHLYQVETDVITWM